MRLRELFPQAQGDPEVTSLAYDGRRVRPGALFFCVRGFTRDGHDFAEQAVSDGAVALVVDHPLGLGVPEVLVDDVRAAMAPAAATLHGDPSARLDVVGITGTSGKTTTAFLVRELLQGAGRQTALLGTVKSVVAGREGTLARTTPEAVDLQAAFADMADGGDVACAMEVSSHALELHRADAIHWAAAVFTNLSQDHLDFHPTMEEYFLAKRRLFEAGPRHGIVVVDDAWGARLAAEMDVTTVSVDGDADLRAVDVRSGLEGTDFAVLGRDGARLELHSPLRGRFNVANALCAIAVARALGVDDPTIAAALRDAAPVPGRLQPVEEGQPFAVLVDYAHKPGALESVLHAARGLTSGRVIVVFGAGGDRDRGKRPMMGEIAGRLADEVVVTSDNPRSEDPDAIIAEIVRGVGRDDVVVEPDRRAAIELAVTRARAGDVVVVAGKGHEQGQEFAGGEKVPFDDVAVAREALRARLVA
ncbi:MAG: UDP-N-acetylmuramoyl-L-alanyl-D-glutamate--2,6-diaminopimelate ligase [Solirubrobacteraceae bacterium]|nr:UDP-N-acetylmuramoyl-L-alanyl-D-glutamate--2,6-diaminopimelate ligase [Solirubrobacteraceae bacterium]